MATLRKARPRQMRISRKLYISGGVLMLGVPAPYARELGWRPGDEVYIELKGKELRVWRPVILHPGR